MAATKIKETLDGYSFDLKYNLPVTPFMTTAEAMEKRGRDYGQVLGLLRQAYPQAAERHDAWCSAWLRHDPDELDDELKERYFQVQKEIHTKAAQEVEGKKMKRQEETDALLWSDYYYFDDRAGLPVSRFVLEMRKRAAELQSSTGLNEYEALTRAEDEIYAERPDWHADGQAWEAAWNANDPDLAPGYLQRKFFEERRRLKQEAEAFSTKPDEFSVLVEKRRRELEAAGVESYAALIRAQDEIYSERPELYDL